VGYGCYTLGIPRLPLGVVSMVSNTKPFFAALLSFCFMKELLSKVEIGFMVLSFLGIILISFSKQLEGDDTESIVSEA
jgi:drug/metabolite transporter (DMT)-like permease